LSMGTRRVRRARRGEGARDFAHRDARCDDAVWSENGEGVYAGVCAEDLKPREETMKKTVISHAAFGCATALLASFVTYLSLAPGGTFYEPPGALHAVSRNGSATQPVKYLVIQISDPTKPQTVPE